MMKNSTFELARLTFDNAGKSETVEYVTIADTCVALLQRSDLSVLLVKQYRPIFDDVTVEVPGGSQEPGETPSAAVERELAEETGLKATSLHALRTIALSVGASDEKVHIFRVDSTAGELEKLEPGIEPIWYSLASIDAMVASGEIYDAKTLISLLHIRRR